MIVWIDAGASGAAPPIFGIDLIERHLHALRALQPGPDRVIIDLAAGQSPLKLPDRISGRWPIEWRTAKGDFQGRFAEILEGAGGQPILALDAGTLIDPRLPASLAKLHRSVAVLPRQGEDRAAILLLDADRPSAETLLESRPADLWDLAKRLLDAGLVAALQDADFDGFVRRLRRTLPYYLFRIDGPARAAKVERFLFWSNYKGSTDIFTRYVYPPLVWAMVRPLARWRVHPNWVTLLSIVLALGAIPFWASGLFVIGFVMAYGMSVLDSVDGKLARLTFTDGELGNVMDHGLDMIHPPLWYMSWAYGLGVAAEGWHSALGRAAIAIFVLYVVDRLVLKIYPRIFKRAFHTHSRMDGLVRSFISRRNINLPLFTVGYLIGFGREAFFLIVAWQAATTLYHASRTFWILAVEKAHRNKRPPVEVGRKIVDF
jgi:phosphatidylglycerophosphate synthase